jgi:hypothetical protein
MALPKIKMERPSVYNGLDWLIALDEGLFAKEGLEVELIAHGGERDTNVEVSDWNQVKTSGDKLAQTPPAKGMVWVNTDSKVYH